MKLHTRLENDIRKLPTRLEKLLKEQQKEQIKFEIHSIEGIIA
ncbi:hypothetical protein SAMN05428987_5220 [Paenibacillus sp. CF095]|nr:hypothetical protein SAMN05428987_5220 [Paenibacillus sp. CF095]